MARQDEDPALRDSAPIQIDNILECPQCSIEFDHTFTAPDGVFEREDLIEAPEEDVSCPACAHTWRATWEGWLAHDDA